MSPAPNDTPDAVAAVTPLGFPWQTPDPFLFCVHHDDAYPAGNEHLGPAASLAGARPRPGLRGQGRLAHVPRRHGARLPAAPAPRLRDRDDRAPRASSTTRDSLGAAARFGGGDVQWLTAGKGIVHAEMFPLLDRDAAQPARAVPDLAQPAARRQAGRAALLDALGRRHPAPRRARTPRAARPRSPSSPASSGDAASAPRAAAGLVGRAARRRRRDLDDQAGARRAVDAAGGGGGHATARSTSSRAAALRVGGRAMPVQPAHRAARAPRPSPLENGPTRPSCCCCRAGRSASRWCSTARS